MPLIRKPSVATAAQAIVHDALKGLVSDSPDERWSAARAAATAEGGDKALAAALQSETDPHVRAAMLTSLARIGSLISVNAILQLLRSDDASLRTEALDALQIIGPSIAAHLPTLLNDDDQDIRLLCCELVRHLPSNEATQLLCELLAREQEANVCAAAVDVLADIGSSAALPTLTQCELRFHDNQFLKFAIKIASNRIQSQTESPHV